MGVKIQPKKEIHQSNAKVTIQKPDKTIVEETELVSEEMLDAPVANVGMTAGITKSPAPYESIKVSVSLYMPCKPDNIDATADFVKQWVDGRMEMLVKELEDSV